MKPADPLLHKTVRWIYLALGLGFVMLGIIGAVLPVMPTTIFLILALACFSRASPRLEQRLLAHPRYGKSLRDWRDHRVVSRRGKYFASAGMLLGLIIMLAGHAPLWAAALAGTVEAGVLVFLWRCPEKASTTPHL